jgi:hypothetical protein
MIPVGEKELPFPEYPAERAVSLMTPEVNGRMAQRSFDRKGLLEPRGDGGFVLG